VIAPGRCFRSDKIDASHFPVFHQVEGFFVDTDVTFADLKATLIEFAKKMFGNELEARFRPSFFPFTEPSAEMDISCLFCRGKGCRVCKSTGWIEILGSGMIDPAVFEAVQYDAEAWTGFAFGMGVERIAMLKYGIGDIRFFYENDLKFLEQFL
jgi:phenylalanyl-tRNA synthetase alpha chain